MKVKNGAFIVIFALLVAVSAAALIFAGNVKAAHPVAYIYLEGELYRKIDLSAVTESYTLDVGDGNTVLIEPGQISMAYADCPDKLCVKQGPIRNGTIPIVCLPNRVVVTVIDDKDAAFDGVTGRAG